MNNISEEERAKRLLKQRREMGRTVGRLPDSRPIEERKRHAKLMATFKKKQRAIIEETLEELKREEKDG